ncbi:MAG: Arm DNA-binding domain-containing protein [Novosphingobium sp.]|uniref:Arm DNA-binding domain-containing protein n=1 Tax=Novosphingobium sp. TaxID=1874826 RepID=UPI00301A90CB
MALTDVAIRQAKPGPKPYKVADGEGLYLLMTPAGGKLWRLKYRLAGKEKLMAFGAYPEVSLVAARKRRDEARQQLPASKDPSREKQRAKGAATGRSHEHLCHHIRRVLCLAKERRPRRLVARHVHAERISPVPAEFRRGELTDRGD